MTGGPDRPAETPGGPVPALIATLQTALVAPRAGARDLALLTVEPLGGPAVAPLTAARETADARLRSIIDMVLRGIPYP